MTTRCFSFGVRFVRNWGNCKWSSVEWLAWWWALMVRERTAGTSAVDRCSLVTDSSSRRTLPKVEWLHRTRLVRPRIKKWRFQIVRRNIYKKCEYTLFAHTVTVEKIQFIHIYSNENSGYLSSGFDHTWPPWLGCCWRIWSPLQDIEIFVGLWPNEVWPSRGSMWDNPHSYLLFLYYLLNVIMSPEADTYLFTVNANLKTSSHDVDCETQIWVSHRPRDQGLNVHDKLFNVNTNLRKWRSHSSHALHLSFRANKASMAVSSTSPCSLCFGFGRVIQFLGSLNSFAKNECIINVSILIRMRLLLFNRFWCMVWLIHNESCLAWFPLMWFI